MLKGSAFGHDSLLTVKLLRTGPVRTLQLVFAVTRKRVKPHPLYCYVNNRADDSR
jgi:hypothetical protein